MFCPFVDIHVEDSLLIRGRKKVFACFKAGFGTWIDLIPEQHTASENFDPKATVFFGDLPDTGSV